MPNPEGYRKAIRMYEMADRFGLPVLTFVDTAGAFPGIGAEERGQSEAIGASLEVMARLGVPIVTTVIGEGGSGGALALGMGNRVLMLEFGYYSVITPEGCAAILWKSAEHAPEAAARLKITAPNLLELGIIDSIIEEPPGGAHQDHDEAATMVDRAIYADLSRAESPLSRRAPRGSLPALPAARRVPRVAPASRWGTLRGRRFRACNAFGQLDRRARAPRRGMPRSVAVRRLGLGCCDAVQCPTILDRAIPRR